MKIKCNCEKNPTEIEFVGDKKNGYKGVCVECHTSFGFRGTHPVSIYNPYKGSRRFRRPQRL